MKIRVFYRALLFFLALWIMPVRVLDDNETVNMPYFAYKLLDKKEGKRVLGCNVARKGYKPIRITLQNKTDKSYFVALSNISLPIIPPEYIVPHMMKSTFNRVVGFIIGTTVIGGLGIIFGALGENQLLSQASDVLFASGIGGATALGIGSRMANKKIKRAFSQTTFPKKAQLVPGGTLSGIVFVRKNTATQNVTFNVQEVETGSAVTLQGVIS